MESIIGSDLVPTQLTMDLFCDGEIFTLLSDELLTIWNNADMRIFNLEVLLLKKYNN